MDNNYAKILLVDDDVELVTLLKDYLATENFVVSSAHNGSAALELLAKQQFDLVVLDVMMPGMSGTDVLARIRETLTIPVIMLTAKGDPVDRILGLELGADDYVPKPCPPRELVARMRAILRRSTNTKPVNAPLQLGDLVVDMAHRRVQYQSTPIDLTGTELTLFEQLARDVGKIIAKNDLYAHVLGRPMGRYDRAIDVHVSAIRRKLADVAGDRIRIESVRGVGYQLIVEDAQK